MNVPRKLRIGRIAYANVLPVVHFFEESRFQDRVEFVHRVPSELNRALAAGELDVSAISAFSYAEHADRYLVFPNLSVSAHGPVRSIFLFSKRPLEELDGARVALTNTSATSVNLLKVILQKFYGFQVTYEIHPPHLPAMMERADAALLIGDDAIMARRAGGTMHVYDLGELWNQFTGYSMTFALWAVRKDAIGPYEPLLKEVYASLLESKDRGRANLRQLAKHASEHYGDTEAFWLEYFAGLTHDFADEHRTGLEYYYAACASLGLLPTAARVNMWEDVLVKTTFTS